MLVHAICPLEHVGVGVDSLTTPLVSELILRLVGSFGVWCRSLVAGRFILFVVIGLQGSEVSALTLAITNLLLEAFLGEAAVVACRLCLSVHLELVLGLH